MKNKAIFKFNSGMLALLCSTCSTIIKIGNDFTTEERSACNGKSYLQPQYCYKCQQKKNNKMSTTFAIFNIPVETDDDGQITSEYNEDDYLKVAYRSSGIILLGIFDVLKEYIKEDTKVYPLDNTAQGIYTFGDILKGLK